MLCVVFCHPNYTIGGVYYRTFSNCPIGSGPCLVVEYKNWAHCCDPNNIAGTFEAVLMENGSVLMQFLDGGSEEGYGSTTAVEGNNAPANHGLTYACNIPASLPDGLSICYIYPGSSGCLASNVPWLGEAPASGTVPAYGSLDLTLSFSATASAGVTRTGDYYATLVVNGNPQIRVPVTMTVVSASPPMAAFTSNSPVCLGETMRFTDTSQAYPPIFSWHWDFGDGFTSTLQNPTHTYSLAGPYTVFLTVENLSGTASVSHTVTVYPLPEASFDYSPASGPAPLTVYFTSTSQYAVSPTWAFGDGAYGAGEAVSHTYTRTGSYTVALTVTSPYGCGTEAASAPVEVYPPSYLVADFQAEPAEGCAPLLVSFTDRSQGNPPILSWRWDFGDGFTSTLQNPTHTYSLAGPYTVFLTVENLSGTASVSHTVTVNPLPEASFDYSPASGPAPLTVYFTSTSLYAVSPTWAFGDGAYGAGEAVSHTYTLTGTYTAALTVTSPYGCGTGAISHSVVVRPAGPTGYTIYLPLVFR